MLRLWFFRTLFLITISAGFIGSAFANIITYEVTGTIDHDFFYEEFDGGHAEIFGTIAIEDIPEDVFFHPDAEYPFYSFTIQNFDLLFTSSQNSEDIMYFNGTSGNVSSCGDDEFLELSGTGDLDYLSISDERMSIAMHDGLNVYLKDYANVGDYTGISTPLSNLTSFGYGSYLTFNRIDNVPEPTTISLYVLSLICLAGIQLRRKHGC